MAHTPGPWECFEGSRNPAIRNADGSIAFVVGGRSRSSYAKAMSRQEALANAHLIAAAPELLEALKAAQQELRLIRMKDSNAVYDTLLRILTIPAAIDKAEGRR